MHIIDFFDTQVLDNYLHQVNVVNGAGNVFTRIQSVVLSVCAQQRDVIMLFCVV